MLSGLFFAIAAMKFGLDRLRNEVVNGEDCDLPIGRWWVFLVGVLVPVEAVTLMVWWLRNLEDGWWDPFATFSVGTVLVQWAVALIAFLALNKWLVRHSGVEALEGDG